MNQYLNDIFNGHSIQFLKLSLQNRGGGGAKDSADFCVRIIEQKVASHPVEN